MAPVLSSTEGFPPGTNLSTWRWPQGTRMTAPLQVAVLPSSLKKTSRGTASGEKSAACLSSVCACPEVRPLLCLVRATPLHVCVCVSL